MLFYLANEGGKKDRRIALYISYSEIHTRHLSPVIGGCIITDIVVDHAIIGKQSDVSKCLVNVNVVIY